MIMKPSLRRFVRTAHMIFTIGWFGAVASFLVLAVAGVTTQNVQFVSAAYLGMELITQFVIVPLSILPLLLTGPVLSLGTPWGLFRHYWILMKLAINILSTVILLLHLQPIRYLSQAAAEGTLSASDRGLQTQMVLASGAGLLALLIATVLAVYKPRGMTAYGWRKQYENPKVPPGAGPAR